MEKIREIIGINGFTLKWIAIITMVIDHTGMMFFPYSSIPRIVGRMAFPIFCFLLVEGFLHTHDRKKYALRLLLFAVVSEIPFDLAIYLSMGQKNYFAQQNVFFTLFLGLLLLILIERSPKVWWRMLMTVLVCLAAYFFMTDYNMMGVLLILAFYVFQTSILGKAASLAFLDWGMFGGIQNFAILSILPIWLYNGQRGPKMKYFFYVFYPAHLLLLCIIRIFI